MKTWNDYKEYVKSVDDKSRRQMEEIEEISVIVGAIIEQRQALGLSQRELALRCGIPQSSVARIETLKTVPNLETVLKIMQPLGLRLTVSHSEQF
ncbi:MAG: helix-turn-helix transcriptional regulator [Oscillospiraceae bacterium]|jgi:ribosome-binding protein aMBF1 (putative translation factor)|nr:helix-turn-helix transcriptional regulator [Oscillospiraceae bacterium]